MGIKLNTPSKFQHKRLDKNTHFKGQEKTIFQYLQEHTATAAMISVATGIPHKNICRYKRDLEKAGKLWEVEKKMCAHTGFKAWYLTTNPNYVLNVEPLKDLRK